MALLEKGKVSVGGYYLPSSYITVETKDSSVKDLRVRMWGSQCLFEK